MCSVRCSQSPASLSGPVVEIPSSTGTPPASEAPQQQPQPAARVPLQPIAPAQEVVGNEMKDSAMDVVDVHKELAQCVGAPPQPDTTQESILAPKPAAYADANIQTIASVPQSVGMGGPTLGADDDGDIDALDLELDDSALGADFGLSVGLQQSPSTGRSAQQFLGGHATKRKAEAGAQRNSKRLQPS